MAKVTTDITVTTSWVKVINDAEEYSLLNTTNIEHPELGGTIYVFAKASAPATTDRGIPILPGKGIDFNTFGLSDWYVRAKVAGYTAVVTI